MCIFMPHANPKAYDGENGMLSVWLTKSIIYANIYRNKSR